ncbi:MAG: alanine dehydrogenase [Planctomycetota bacterium]|nr:MAG: alanine dehydrogenase [Planctomycetota bacterium]
MIIGIPKEIKNHEYRIGMTPAGVELLVQAGHTCFVQTRAGEGPGFIDDDYKAAGAEILPEAKDVFDKAEMIIKIKEPVGPEFSMMKKGQIWYTYFHLAGDVELTKKTLETGVIAIAYETMEAEDGSLPLLIPMSEVAGRLATVEGAKYLQATYGGRGIFIGGVPATSPAKVVVLGAGIVGKHAAQMAIGLGADVTIMTRNPNRLRAIDEIYRGRMKTLKLNPINIREELKTADLVIGSVLVTGDKAPWIISREMLKGMQKGAVIVDVSIDQGGCCETSKPTTHADPIYEVDGVIHYCVANMPGCVPRTSTFALTNETIPYALEIANKGWKQACKDSRMIYTGLNTVEGKLTYKPVADVFGIPYTPPEEVF